MPRDGTVRPGRGGPRQGQPGKAYGERTDLNVQPIRTVPGQQYGQAKAQQQAQQAIPLPQVTPIHAPTERPTEPVTAGLPIGPGPGPEAVTPAPDGQANLVAQAIALYRAFPNEDTRRLLAQAQASDPFYQAG